MRIKIAERLRPFSHLLGVHCLLPGTSFGGQFFPTKVRIYDYIASHPQHVADLDFDFLGPIKQFTVRQDLERGHVDVFGFALQGYFHYLLKGAKEGGLEFTVKKWPAGCQLPRVPACISCKHVPLCSVENLSLGCNKAQAWPNIQQRAQLCEIFPIWYRLGQWMHPFVPASIALDAAGGTLSLLSVIEENIRTADLQNIKLNFEKLLLAGFKGMLVPELEDRFYQGLQLPSLKKDATISALSLLSMGQRLIRKMLINLAAQEVFILPALLPELHAGRLLHIQIADYGYLDLEWSKKTIRRMLFKPLKDCELSFLFHKKEMCRLTVENQLKGDQYQNGEAFAFIAHKSYFFDNFQ